MYPLSVFHNKELEKWMNNHPGRVVTSAQICEIFGEAYLKGALPVNGFKKYGIVPMNPDVFSEVDFAAAETTDQALDDEPAPAVEPIATGSSPSRMPRCHSTPVASPNAEYEPEQNAVLFTYPGDTVVELEATFHDATEPQSPTQTLIEQDSIKSATASTSFSQIGPSTLIPIPKMIGTRAVRSTKRLTGTKLLTDTPYKNQLEI